MALNGWYSFNSAAAAQGACRPCFPRLLVFLVSLGDTLSLSVYPRYVSTCLSVCLPPFPFSFFLGLLSGLLFPLVLHRHPETEEHLLPFFFGVCVFCLFFRLLSLLT